MEQEYVAAAKAESSVYTMHSPKRNKNKIIRVYLVELIKQLQLQIHHEVISNDSIKNSSFV
jgi:hypothetical protein